jgi:hypothetical protein
MIFMTCNVYPKSYPKQQTHKETKVSPQKTLTHFITSNSGYTPRHENKSKTKILLSLIT